MGILLTIAEWYLHYVLEAPVAATHAKSHFKNSSMTSMDEPMIPTPAPVEFSLFLSSLLSLSLVESLLLLILSIPLLTSMIANKEELPPKNEYCLCHCQEKKPKGSHFSSASSDDFCSLEARKMGKNSEAASKWAFINIQDWLRKGSRLVLSRKCHKTITK